MVYESQISFTFDTICPWTYLAKKRLDEALGRFQNTSPSEDVTFIVKFFPYQLYPEAGQEGEDKYEWYKKSRFGDSEEKMKMYTTVMSAHGVGVGIDFSFGGVVANTLQAHRVVQHFQEEKGAKVAGRIVDSLYSQYFENERHPSSRSTLLAATNAAGISQAEAETFIDDEHEGLQEVKLLIREQVGNGIDAVPYVVFEGRRRDFTLEGAREVEEYVKELAKVAKECS